MMSNVNETNLNTLATFHYVLGGIGVVFSLFPIIHVGIGYALVSGAIPMTDDSGNPPPDFVGYLFMGLGLIFILIGQLMSWLIIYSGRKIKRRQMRQFSFILGCIMCLFFPFGTVLGVFTIILLNKEEIKILYQT